MEEESENKERVRRRKGSASPPQAPAPAVQAPAQVEVSGDARAAALFYAAKAEEKFAAAQGEDDIPVHRANNKVDWPVSTLTPVMPSGTDRSGSGSPEIAAEPSTSLSSRKRHLGSRIAARRVVKLQKSASSLHLLHGNLKGGGTDEVMQAVAFARQELLAFIQVEPPPFSLLRSIGFGVAVFNIRPALKHFPVGSPFTRTLMCMGGLERVQLLLTIARFDANGNVEIDQTEFDAARVQGEKCIANAVAGCGNFAIISALLFGATHMVTIGRPGPFKAHQDSIDAFGEGVTTPAVWACYALNVCAQSLALASIIISIYMRQLLCNSLPSMMSKLVFLSDTNVLSLLATGTTWMIACLVWLVTVGGFISSPTYGLMSTGMIPIILLLILPLIYPAMLKTALRLHAETRMTLQVGGVYHDGPIPSQDRDDEIEVVTIDLAGMD